jgi:hypothetical protein
MRGWHRLAMGLALAGLVPAAAAGCASASGTASDKPGGDVAGFEARAKLVVAAWDKAGLTKEWQTGLVLMTPDELISPGDRDFATGDQKAAFVTGQFTLAGKLPDVPLRGKVRWLGGATATVGLMSATQAYRKIATEQPCPGQPCPPKLVVTGAKPGTVEVGTSRGNAIVPAWTFIIPSLPSPITVGALAPGSYHTQPAALHGLPAFPAGGFAGAGLGRVSDGGWKIDVLVATLPCDTQSGPLVYETSTAVVVGGWTYNPHPDAGCELELRMVSTPVKLAKPLGQRVVLSVGGNPLAPSHF